MTDDGVIYNARIKGKFRLEDNKFTNPVAVGDVVTMEYEDGEEAATIFEIAPRDNYISRISPKHKHARHIIAANMDQAIVVATIAQPRTSSGFIDRFLITAEAYHIPAHIVFNKQDVYRPKDLAKQEMLVDIYKKVGYAVHKVSALTGEGMEGLNELLKDQITLVAGHSGVGKSTLINALHPDLNIKTSDISKKYKKGTHTTTYAEMHELPFGGFIIDTPGIKEFGILDLEPHEISHYFPEMRDRLQDCQFNNCLHIDEPKCAIIEALEADEIDYERYKNYFNIVMDSQNRPPHYA